MAAQHFFLFAAAAYAAGGGVAIAALRAEGLRKGPWLHLAVVLGVIFHTLGIGLHCARSETHFFTSWAENLWLLSWALGTGYLGLLTLMSARSLAALLLPLMVALLAAAHFLAEPGAPSVASVAQNRLLPVHIVSAFLGYGLFLSACAASLLYLQSHRLLKRKVFGVLFHGLPSLEKLERAATVSAWAGFAIFTLALGTGAYLAKDAGDPQWYMEPKFLATQVTWLVFLVLLVGRLSGRLSGRGAARVIVAGAAMVVLTFLLSHPFREPAGTPAASEADSRSAVPFAEGRL